MGNPDKTYDETQREAVLTPCSRCPKWFYCTHPRPNFVCHYCEDEAFVQQLRERCQEQETR